jgi:antitoxin CptB
MDLILGRFADIALDGLVPAEIDVFESLLSENDHDLYRWVAGADSIPEIYQEIVLRIRSDLRLP